MSEPMNTLRMIGSTITDRAEKLAQIDTEEAHIRLDELAKIQSFVVAVARTDVSMFEAGFGD